MDWSTTTGDTLEDVRLAIIQRVKQTGFNYSDYPKYNVKECDCCGSKKEDWTLYAHCDRYGLPVRSMQCGKCGLIFISPRMDLNSYRTFYLKWYRKLVNAFDGREQPKERLDYSIEKQADDMVKFLGQAMPNESKINRMLDVGGSTGVFCKKVCDVTGCIGHVVEPNKEELSEAVAKGLTTCCNSFEWYRTDHKFDLISMLRTVEHLNTIQGGLRKIWNLLNPNGLFLLDIVNHKFMLQITRSKTLSTKLDHIYQLTDDVIKLYLKNQGFELIESTDPESRYIKYLAKKND